MAIRFSEWARQNPGFSVGGEGRWLVIWHGGRSTRYPSYFDAQRESIGECSRCDGKQPHAIVELAVESAQQFRPSRSFRKMVAAD